MRGGDLHSLIPRLISAEPRIQYNFRVKVLGEKPDSLEIRELQQKNKILLTGKDASLRKRKRMNIKKADKTHYTQSMARWRMELSP